MRNRLLWNVAGLALWLTISLILQAAGLSLLTSHLLAAAVALTTVAVISSVLRKRAADGPGVR